MDASETLGVVKITFAWIVMTHKKRIPHAVTPMFSDCLKFLLWIRPDFTFIPL